jgi:putative oligomerization/nucleic acid binding protein
MSATQSTRHGPKHISPERLLVGYLIIVFRLLVRAVGKAFGVSGEGSTLLTLIVIASVARGVRRAFAAPRAQVRKARSSPHAVGDTVIATAAFKETVDSIAGHPSRKTSFAAGLIVFAVLAHSVRPAAAALRKTVRAVITAGLRVRAWFAARGSMIAARTRDVVAEAAGRDPDSRDEPHPTTAQPAPTQAAASRPPNEEIARLADLHRSGALTDEEFNAAQARLLG